MRYYLILLLFSSIAAVADPLNGEKKVFLESINGEQLHIANIKLETISAEIFYTLTIRDEPFSNQFLSMRPFQCIMGEQQVMCYVPYPYAKKGHITKNDLSNLSYDLLFLHKNPSEYGINLWNGMFYKLKMKENSITGIVHEVDMNIIASPPENKDAPFAEDEIFEADVGNYVYPKIIIK